MNEATVEDANKLEYLVNLLIDDISKEYIHKGANITQGIMKTYRNADNMVGIHISSKNFPEDFPDIIPAFNHLLHYISTQLNLPDSLARTVLNTIPTNASDTIEVIKALVDNNVNTQQFSVQTLDAFRNGYLQSFESQGRINLSFYDFLIKQGSPSAQRFFPLISDQYINTLLSSPQDSDKLHSLLTLISNQLNSKPDFSPYNTCIIREKVNKRQIHLGGAATDWQAFSIRMRISNTPVKICLCNLMTNLANELNTPNSGAIKCLEAMPNLKRRIVVNIRKKISSELIPFIDSFLQRIVNVDIPKPPSESKQVNDVPSSNLPGKQQSASTVAAAAATPPGNSHLQQQHSHNDHQSYLGADAIAQAYSTRPHSPSHKKDYRQRVDAPTTAAAAAAPTSNSSSYFNTFNAGFGDQTYSNLPGEQQSASTVAAAAATPPGNSHLQQQHNPASSTQTGDESEAKLWGDNLLPEIDDKTFLTEPSATQHFFSNTRRRSGRRSRDFH